MPTERIGIREFREKLADYLESPTPVAITRHGQTLGVYVPTRRHPNEDDLESLRRAGEQLSLLIASSGTTEDELVSDFKVLRKTGRRSRASSR